MENLEVMWPSWKSNPSLTSLVSPIVPWRLPLGPQFRQVWRVPRDNPQAQNPYS